VDAEGERAKAMRTRVIACAGVLFGPWAWRWCCLPLPEWLKLRRDVIEAFGFEENDSLGEESDKPEISDTELAAYLEYLLEAMEEADLDRADAIVAELEKYGYPAEQRTFLEQIKMSVLNIDEKACREAVDTWRKYL